MIKQYADGLSNRSSLLPEVEMLPYLYLSGIECFGPVFTPVWHDTFPEVVSKGIACGKRMPRKSGSELVLLKMLDGISDRNCEPRIEFSRGRGISTC